MALRGPRPRWTGYPQSPRTGHARCEAQQHLDVLRTDPGNATATSTRRSTP